MPGWDHGALAGPPRETVLGDDTEVDMSKRGRKKRDRKKNKANHGRRPNS